MKRKLAAIGLLMVLAVGCTKHAVSVHPGSLSNVDSYSYDVLLVEQDALNSAKSAYSTGALPTGSKSALNYAIAQYDVALAAWQSYHSGATKDTKALDAAITALVGAVGELQKQLGKQLPGGSL